MIRLLSTAIACLVFAPSLATAQQGSSEVISLFDAKSLDGWRGRSDLWSVEQGAIVGRTTAEEPLKKNTFLIWEGDLPENFELLVTYWIESGNSGIQYRSRVLDEEDFVVGGYQADIEVTNKFTGINYEEKGRGILAQRGQRVTIAEDGSKDVEVFGDAAEIAKTFRTEGWNSYRVVAQGNRLQHFINEQLTSEVIDGQTDKASTSGVIALQLHVGPPMVVRFRDITVRALNE